MTSKPTASLSPRPQGDKRHTAMTSPGVDAKSAVKPSYRVQWDRENWMVRKLLDITGVRVGATGLTTLEQRQDQIRELIARHNLTDKVIGRPSGKPVTWAMMFTQTFGVPLVEAPQGSLL